jgi:hypothetical protein
MDGDDDEDKDMNGESEIADDESFASVDDLEGDIRPISGMFSSSTQNHRREQSAYARVGSTSREGP